MPPPKGYIFCHGFLRIVVLTLSLLKYMTTSIFVFGMTPRCCKVSTMYFMLGESPNEGPNDHIWLHNCQANLCMFLRFSNFLSERERERDHGQHPNFEISIILKFELSNWFYWGLEFQSKPHRYFWSRGLCFIKISKPQGFWGMQQFCSIFSYNKIGDEIGI